MSSAQRPLVHFAHANGFPSGSYRALFQELETHCDLIAIDKLAHNPAHPIRDGWLELSQELIAYLEQQADRPVIGIGHSMGAVLTFLAARQRPDLFERIIMLDPPLAVGAAGLAFKLCKPFKLIDKLTPAGKTQNRKTCWQNQQEAFDYFRPKGLFRGISDATLLDYLNSATHQEQGSDTLCLHYQVENECNIYRTIPCFLEYSRPRLSVPGTVIYGLETDVSKPAFVKRFAGKQKLQLKHTEGGHMFPLQHPEQTARLLLSQLAL